MTEGRHSPAKRYMIFFMVLNCFAAVSIFDTKSFINYHILDPRNQSSLRFGEKIKFHVKYDPDNLDRFGEMQLRRTFVDDKIIPPIVTPTLPRVLIAQYDYGNFNNSYADIIKISSKVNKAYASKYNHDYLLARGVFIKVIGTNNPNYSKGRVAAGSTSNKVGILEYAFQHPTKKWDYVLILDSDAMMYDFERDIALIYNMTDEALIAHRVPREANSKTFNINAGVVLWNLRHEQTKRIVSDWDKEIYRVFTTRVGEDQAALHSVLRRIPLKNRPIRAINNDFEYASGTVVKHFIRPGSEAVKLQWDDKQLKTENRVKQMKQTADVICEKYKAYCDQVSPEY